ncbi:DUF4190 domain-containing protein [Sphingobacteriales bacterium UPWRP_1]|nr:hypothetical protein B6N25_00475 [Sphingobacteriales bacterium TSM_CSS]PSJ71921.1 DUF4190 domain-containing protein [Sphingobacteriales bacterium UPWRP_1]
MKNFITLLCLLAVFLIFLSSCSSSKLACPTFTNGSNTSFALKNEKAGRKEATAWKRTGKHTPPLPAATSKPEAQLPAKTATALPINNHGNPTLPPQNAFAGTNNPNAELLTATAPPPVHEAVDQTVAVSASGYKAKRPFAAVRQLRQVKKAVAHFRQNNTFSLPSDSVKNTAVAPPQQATEKVDKMALAGGILAIVGWFVPYIGIIAVVAGVALCIIALKQGTKRKKLARGALIFSGVMLILAIVISVLFLLWLLEGLLSWG